MDDYNFDLHHGHDNDVGETTTVHDHGGDGTRGHLNLKMLSYQNRDSHYKDKTLSRQSYRYNGKHHTWKNYIETVQDHTAQQCTNPMHEFLMYLVFVNVAMHAWAP